MQQIKYSLSNDLIHITIDIDAPGQEMVLEKWQEICDDLMGQKITQDLVSQVEQQMAEWVISQISVTSDFEVK